MNDYKQPVEMLFKHEFKTGKKPTDDVDETLTKTTGCQRIKYVKKCK